MKNQALLNQKKAADFNISSWVMASAGSGKTKILTDRVLNLLLQGTSPEKILCLTFTKAAAKEMIERISSTLSSWVVKSDKELEEIISNLHDEFAEIISSKNKKYFQLMQKARMLFAETMEVSGGMKIMTIHGFCQSVLKRFPLEAKVSPYFEVIEESHNRGLMEKVRHEVMEDVTKLDSLALISSFVNEEEFVSNIQSLLKNKDSLENLKQNPEEKLKNILNINTINEKELIKQHISKNIQDIENIKTSAFSEDKTIEIGNTLKRFITDNDNINDYFSIFLTLKGDLRSKQNKIISELAPELPNEVFELYEDLKNIKIYNCSLIFINIALDIINKYEQLKYKDCLLDYDDLINNTKNLLSNKELAPWVLYKLDGGIDHILVDEAQDTSPQQWAIIQALTEEIFSGIGGQEEKNRTLFVVGDRKQSIYSFQGASIETFDTMRCFFENKIKSSNYKFEEIPINISFRSSPEVLNFVDMVFNKDEARDGVLYQDETLNHIPFYSDSCGKVEVWDLCRYESESKSQEEQWKLPIRQSKQLSTKEVLSVKIAEEIKSILENKYIQSNKKDATKFRKVEPKDIMILVRHRDDLATEIIRNLKTLNIPVAGIDRLSLLEHIAVQDLISLGRFLLHPDDDLSLAEVLKSPLIGIEEQDLFDLSYNRQEKSIWQNIKLKNHYSFESLNDLLQKADFISPFEMYSYILNVKKARQKFLARLGEEALDALDEFLNLVKNYCDNNVPSMQNLINFIEHDKVEIKREQEQSNLVRLITVHGSKGLQAPIVFLPDTTGMGRETIRILWIDGVPLWLPKSEMLSSRINPYMEKEKEIRKKEYRRLLYVAMTRAADELYICGYDFKKAPPKGNWYELIKSAVEDENNIEKFIKQDDGKYVLQLNNPINMEKEDVIKKEKNSIEKPYWIASSVPIDNILKPLKPSQISEDSIVANSPLVNQKNGFLKGNIVHKILQYLPNIPKDEWNDYINLFLEKYKNELSLSVLNNIKEKFVDLQTSEDFNKVLMPEGLSEVPICAVDENNIINGQIDRLIILDKEIIIIDYKSNHNVPKTKNEVPDIYIKQIKNYRKVMNKIYPSHNIKSYIFWVENLYLMEL